MKVAAAAHAPCILVLLRSKAGFNTGANILGDIFLI